MLLCCKFAEGDSRILQMKLMRDRLKRVKREGPIRTALSGLSGGAAGREARAALQLASKLAPAGRDVQKMDKLFAEHFEEIYALSGLIEDRIIEEMPPSGFVEGPVVDRLAAADTMYDSHWMQKLSAGNGKAV